MSVGASNNEYFFLVPCEALSSALEFLLESPRMLKQRYLTS